MLPDNGTPRHIKNSFRGTGPGVLAWKACTRTSGRASL